MQEASLGFTLLCGVLTLGGFVLFIAGCVWAVRAFVRVWDRLHLGL